MARHPAVEREVGHHATHEIQIDVSRGQVRVADGHETGVGGCHGGDAAGEGPATVAGVEWVQGDFEQPRAMRAHLHAAAHLRGSRERQRQEGDVDEHRRVSLQGQVVQQRVVGPADVAVAGEPRRGQVEPLEVGLE